MRMDRMNPQSSAHEFMKCAMQRRNFKLSSRFGDEHVDVIDDGEADEFPEDKDNIEKQEEMTENAAKTKNTSDDASNHYLLYPTFLASLTLSRVLPSILLRL